MKRVTDHAHAGGHAGRYPIAPFDRVVLAHDERHLRRKVLTLSKGEQVLVDLPEAIAFGHGDLLVLEDRADGGDHRSGEKRYTRSRHATGSICTELAWHLGNRHLPAQLEEHPDRHSPRSRDQGHAGRTWCTRYRDRRAIPAIARGLS